MAMDKSGPFDRIGVKSQSGKDDYVLCADHVDAYRLEDYIICIVHHSHECELCND